MPFDQRRDQSIWITPELWRAGKQAWENAPLCDVCERSVWGLERSQSHFVDLIKYIFILQMLVQSAKPSLSGYDNCVFPDLHYRHYLQSIATLHVFHCCHGKYFFKSIRLHLALQRSFRHQIRWSSPLGCALTGWAFTCYTCFSHLISVSYNEYASLMRKANVLLFRIPRWLWFEISCPQYWFTFSKC